MTATLCAPCVLAPDPAALERFWAALVSPGDVHAVRVPNTRRGPLRLFGTAEGYFDDVERFVSDVSPISGQDAPGVYVTLNPVSPALLARADNRLVDRAKSAAGDGDALRRRHLLIDTDPVRQPRDVSATDEELAKALSRRDAARRYLAEQHGWPDPAAVTHSGNGGGLIYRIDLPNDAAATALIRDVLAALDHLFSDEIVTADAGNFNAARITKIVGSVAAKGENFSGTDRAPARPWRLATATYPPQPGVVTPALLAAVAALAPRVAPAPQALRLGAGLAPAPRLWTVEDLLAVNGLAARPKRQGYGTVYQLDRCLSSEDHADGAVLLEMANGAIVYRCLHERCRGKDWRFLREHGLVTIPGAAHGTGHAPPTPNGHGSVNGRSGAPGGSRADQGEEDGKARFSRLTDSNYPGPSGRG